MKLAGAGLQRVVGEMQAAEAEAFNDDVAVVCESLPNAVVRKRVKKTGHRRIVRDNGEDLGDIDVLVIDPRRRIVWPIETKDLAVARTPAELATELRITFAEGGRKQSHAEKHLARAEWVRSHLGEVLHALGIEAGSVTDWVVRPLIVVSHELMTPYIASSPIRVVPSIDLLGVLNTQHRR